MDKKSEAYQLALYLLGGLQPNSKTLELYEKAIHIKTFTVTAQDKKIMTFVLKHPWTLGMIDAALAFTHPTSLLRSKLLLMLAILETMPEYAHLFLPRQRPFLYHFYIGWVGFRAVVKAGAGILFLKVI